MKERKRKHDDAHVPLGGTGRRANRKHYDPPRAVFVPDNPGTPQGRLYTLDEIDAERTRRRELWDHGRNCICPECMPPGTSQAH